MTSHGAACGVQGPCRGKEKAGYSLLLSPFLRSISLPLVSPDGGPLRHAVVHRCVLSVGCLAWLPRGVPVRPSMWAGGFVVRPVAYQF